MFKAMTGRARSLLVLAATLALAAGACSGNSGTTAPGSTVAPGSTTPEPLVTPVSGSGALPTPAASPATPTPSGWSAVLRSVAMSPGREGWTNIEAKVLLVWHGQAPGQPPTGLLGAIATDEGNSYSAGVVGFNGQLGNGVVVPDGFGLPYTFTIEWPSALAHTHPALVVRTSDGSNPIATLPFDTTSEPSLPAVVPGATLDVDGVASIHPTGLVVWHWVPGTSTALNQNGTWTQYAGAGANEDHWVVAVGLTITNTGSQDLNPGFIPTALVDQSWEIVSTSSSLGDPRNGGPTIPPGVTKSFELDYSLSSEPTSLRLVVAVPDAGGVTHQSVIGYDGPAIRDAESAFITITDGMFHYQQSCTATYNDAGLRFEMISTSLLSTVGILDDHTAVVRSSNDYANVSSGAYTGNTTKTYALERTSGGAWQVVFPVHASTSDSC
jgi:hypothetical protein